MLTPCASDEPSSGRLPKRIVGALIGERPRAIVWLLVPTLLALALDTALRARVLFQYPWIEAVSYAGGVFLSAGIWGGSMWLASPLLVSRSRIGKVGVAAFACLWVWPLATFSFGGQALYYRVFHSYMARDTVRLGISLRGTVFDWFAAWGGIASFVGVGALGVVVSVGFLAAARRAAPSLAKTVPIIPVLALTASFYSLWIDWVGSRTLQSALPDTCFAHGVVHAVRLAVTGKGVAARGVSLRSPAALPPLPQSAHRPNVLLVITESVRADALCSAKAPTCSMRFLDDVAPDRVALGNLTTQSPGTFSSCVMLWTGLPPNADFATLHRAATVWEVAHAAGYQTAYVTSQNMQYNDFHLFTDRAGIDHCLTAVELGDITSNLIGAPDEAATAKLVDFVRTARPDQPYFAVLHLSNTHAPYRVDPNLQPFEPHSNDPVLDVTAFHNHYSNSVLLQERTLSEMLRTLRALPSFDDTVVVFVSDHGEQFRNHGSLYHSHSLFEEELRIPGFILSGAHGLTDEQREGARAFAGRRTYTQDVNATLLDLFGVLGTRQSFPYASLLTGRSLLRAPSAEEPTALMATTTGVWETDPTFFGAAQGTHVLITSSRGGSSCYDLATDPGEQTPLPWNACGALVTEMKLGFPEAPAP